jgi:Fe-S oxidoreductase
MEGRAEMTQEWIENFLACTTCEMCNVKCPLELPNESSWMKIRGELVTEQDRLPIAPLEAMQKRGVKTIVTSCAACWLAWHNYYPQWAKKFGIPFDIKTRHYSEVLADKLKSGDLRLGH